MNRKEQGNETSQIITDAAAQEAIPAKAPASLPTEPNELSDEDLAAVAGGTAGVKKTMQTQV